MKTKILLKKIYTVALLQARIEKLKKEFRENDLFSVLSFFDIGEIYPNCTIKQKENGELYSANGDLLSSDGRCMNEEIPYFVNQATGYCGDDFYGTMFVKVDDKNTFVAISYKC